MSDQPRNEVYYNQEARVYSEKRYPKILENYVQFLFTRRRKLVLDLLGVIIKKTEMPRTLLEVGCADGILLRSIEERYPDAFTSLLGVDISEPMVRQAAALTANSSIHYKVRNELENRGVFTVVLEIGVIALGTDTAGELGILANQLKEGGYLLCSVAGRNSIAARLKKVATHRLQLRTYEEYETAMRERFTLLGKYPYGLYVPLLWRFPSLARVLQPIAEIIAKLLPGLYHEQVYLLKKI